jgi:hypothetical protein
MGKRIRRDERFRRARLRLVPGGRSVALELSSVNVLLGSLVKDEPVRSVGRDVLDLLSLGDGRVDARGWCRQRTKTNRSVSRGVIRTAYSRVKRLTGNLGVESSDGEVLRSGRGVVLGVGGDARVVGLPRVLSVRVVSGSSGESSTSNSSSGKSSDSSARGVGSSAAVSEGGRGVLSGKGLGGLLVAGGCNTRKSSTISSGNI